MFFFIHIFKKIIYFQLNQAFLIFQFILPLSYLFFPSFLHLLHIIERTNVFSKRYDILGFSNSLYLPQITQYNFFILIVFENILVLFYHSSNNH